MEIEIHPFPPPPRPSDIPVARTDSEDTRSECSACALALELDGSARSACTTHCTDGAQGQTHLWAAVRVQRAVDAAPQPRPTHVRSSSAAPAFGSSSRVGTAFATSAWSVGLAPRRTKAVDDYLELMFSKLRRIADGSSRSPPHVPHSRAHSQPPPRPRSLYCSGVRRHLFPADLHHQKSAVFPDPLTPSPSAVRGASSRTISSAVWSGAPWPYAAKETVATWSSERCFSSPDLSPALPMSSRLLDILDPINDLDGVVPIAVQPDSIHAIKRTDSENISASETPTMPQRKTTRQPKTIGLSLIKRSKSEEFDRKATSHAPRHQRNASTHQRIVETSVIYSKEETLATVISPWGDAERAQGHVNQYHILKDIGTGSYGRVVLVRSDQTGLYYACKIISKSRLRRKFRFMPAQPGGPSLPATQKTCIDDEIMATIKREVAVLKKLSMHPNIVNLVEVLDDAKEDNIYMMHYKRIIHRDLKPENLLRTAENVVQIGDFGISHMFDEGDDEEGMPNNKNGSPLYCPPEACLDESVVELCRMIVNESFAVSDTLSDTLKDLLYRMMEKNPKNRIQLPQIKVHAWVTNNGKEPMMSTDENCVFEDVTEEEVAQAFRPAMMFVNKIMSKFKSILAALRRECLDLRMANRDKDTMIAHSARELEARAITIDHGYFSHASRASADMQDHAAAANDRADDMFHDIKNLSLDFASLEAPASQESSIDSMRYIWTQPVSAAFSIQPQKSPVKSEYGDFYQPEPGIAYEYGTEQLQHEFMDVRHTFKNTFGSDKPSLIKILVEKIVKTNDQPSSIYLQQRLKTDPPEIKARIFEAVLQHVIMLMKNRFGNFLVQCCLDCCTPQQIHVLGNCMRGQVISLSCDRFGCHVMQKAIDRVDEEVKLALVSELLKSIPETFTHRFACHVWQRVLETRWTCEPPNVMLYVQAALAGHWAMVANDENGSLVVQCIFENCSEEESLPIVAEIFEHTADIAKGQWGNWVIQHIIEHGTQQQRAHILEVVSQNIFALSIDQFASKVVEKCIKMASKRDAHALIEKIIAPQVSEQGRPYLLGMMNNQYANYVVQNVLSVADSLQRDICIRLLVPHLHILRGSKYGQRVASMCEKYMRLSQHKFTFTNANATAGGGLGASGPAAASPSTLSGAAKSRSKSNLAGSTQRLSKSKSKSLGSMLNMGPLTVAAPLEPPAPDHAEDPEAQRRREERELLEEYARRMASLPLPADMLKRGLSQMGPSPDGLRQVFKKLSIPNAGLNNVSALQEYPYLQNLELQGNNITGAQDISAFGSMRYLVQIDLSNNRLTDVLNFEPPPFNLQQATWLPSNMVVPIHATAQFPPSYRLRTVFQLQKLAVLDSLPVSPEEKIAALNTYDPMHHVVRARGAFNCIEGGQRWGEVLIFCEENGVHYHFVSRQEMERMNEEGKLIEVVSLFGNLYGTSMDAVDKVTEEGKICIMDLEIEGVLALRKSHLRPRYIFITTPNMTVLQQRLQARMSPQSRTLGAQETTMSTQSRRLPTMQEESGASAPGAGGDGAGSDAAVEVTSWLAKAEHTRAEFDASLFDLTVVNDDLERAYRELKEYCMSVYWKDFEEED
nr:Calcium calmodulin-dependent protein kinase kinase 2 [Polyrhizophydium stewartii]